jgi:hypothetical protein
LELEGDYISNTMISLTSNTSTVITDQLYTDPKEGDYVRVTWGRNCWSVYSARPGRRALIYQQLSQNMVRSVIG